MSNKRKRDMEKHLARRYIAGDDHDEILAATDAAGLDCVRVVSAASRIQRRSARLAPIHAARRAARAERARVRRADEWRREEQKRRASAAEVAQP
jgi:hypothetical protein